MNRSSKTATATQRKPRSKKKQDHWTPERLDAFGAELSALGEQTRANLDHTDVAYVKKVHRIAQSAEVIGRSLIHFSVDPFTWTTGVLALWVHHQLNTTELGHSALHGCWDDLAGAEAFASKNYNWNGPVDEAGWKREHNILHHQYTNIVGRDPDLNYGSLRIAKQTPWVSYHLFQFAQFFWTAPLFMWVIGMYVTGVVDTFRSGNQENYAPILQDHSEAGVQRAYQQTLQKMLPYAAYNFVLWPTLAGPFWWKVLAGNVAAELLRNIYTCATIYAGHFGDDLVYYDKSYRPKGRGEWFKLQVEAAHNYKVPKLISVLCGALDHQIEHHLFPKLPPNRLRELAPKVQEICARYGVPYNKASWGNSLGKAFKRIAKMSIPDDWASRYLGKLASA